MRRIVFLLLILAAVCANAQKFIPKTIQFKGAPEYTDQEMMAAADLKKGELLDYAGMNARSQQLLATGVFASLAFKFDGQDLIFTVTPSSDLVPAHFQNFPIASDAELDTILRKQIPLYHGNVPTENGLMESVRVTLEKFLVGQGITATVSAVTAADLVTHKINGVNYSITAPPVMTGNLQLTGVSDALMPEVQKALNDAAKAPFDSANTAPGLRQMAETVLHDHGFAAAKVQVATAGAPAVSADAIKVPFSVSVDAGRVYTISAIHLPADSPLSQDEVSKILNNLPASIPQGVRIRTVWGELSRRYKSHGYLDAAVTPRPAFDDAAGTVSYTVDVVPGPVYHLAFVKFEGVSDQMRALLMRYWQMLPGDVFDESYVGMFAMKAAQQDPTLQRSLVGVKTTYDVTADPSAHTVNVVIHFSR